MKFGSACFAACVVIGIGQAACQPLYGARPEKLHAIEPKKRPPDAPAIEAQVNYIEDCSASFQDDPRKVRQQTAASHQLVDAGDVAIASSDHAAQSEAKGGFIRDAIDKYRNALIKDPYNAEATLKLAVAYDKVLRKGCALALLKRLAALAMNPKIAPDAPRQIEAASENSKWFKGYHKDAMAAIGR